MSPQHGSSRSTLLSLEETWDPYMMLYHQVINWIQNDPVSVSSNLD